MGQLQGQIRDLERYITFLQTKKTRLQPRAKRHDSDSEETSSDYSDEEDEEEMFTPYSLKTKRVTFADEVFLQRNKEGGDFEPPVPDYQVSMTQQLDGVNCALDYSRCEWEKTDTFSQSSSGSKKVCKKSKRLVYYLHWSYNLKFFCKSLGPKGKFRT